MYVLSREDIILSKIGRYSGTDIEDIGKLLVKGDVSLLVQLADAVVKRSNLSLRIKEEFVKNWEKFKEDFRVQTIL